MRKLFFSLLSGFVVILTLVCAPIKSYALDEHRCLACHGNPKLTGTTIDGREISLYIDEKALNPSAHRFIDCTTCHTLQPHKIVVPFTPSTKLSLAEKCGNCHRYQYKLYKRSVHGQQLVLGNLDVATCTDCHSPRGEPHSIIRVLEYNAPIYRKNIAQTCGKCHGNEPLMAKYGISAKVYETYMESFHGKAMRLATYDPRQLDKATCISCHGYHDIRRAKDPASPVATIENLAKVCETCHPGAGIEFARGFPGHRKLSPENIPVAYYAELFFIIYVSTIVAFGIVIVIVTLIGIATKKW